MPGREPAADRRRKLVMEKVAYTVNEALQALGISRNTLYRAIAAGELKTRKIGSRTIILVVDLDDWVSRLPLGNRRAEAK